MLVRARADRVLCLRIYVQANLDGRSRLIHGLGPARSWGAGGAAALMVSALISGSSGPCSSAGWGHCVVFLDKTLHSHSTSLHPGV